MIAKYCEENCFDYENGFYLTSDVYRIGMQMAHYELYKKILNLPGDVIELGVFKGSSLIQFATFRELLENENSRKIVGFDVFGEFPVTCSVESDGRFAKKWNLQFKDEFISREEILKSLDHKKIGNVELIKGRIEETLDVYLEKNPHTRIAMLHIDTDVYEPAIFALEKLWSRIVRPGGIVVFDDYGTVEGETLAVGKFLDSKNLRLNKFTFSHTKPSWVVKE